MVTIIEGAIKTGVKYAPRSSARGMAGFEYRDFGAGFT
jgi:hypothetical protein